MGKRQEERRLKRMLKETAEAFDLPEENVRLYFEGMVKAYSRLDLSSIKPGASLEEWANVKEKPEKK